MIYAEKNISRRTVSKGAKEGAHTEIFPTRPILTICNSIVIIHYLSTFILICQHVGFLGCANHSL